MAVQRLKNAFDQYLVRKYYLELFNRKKREAAHRKGWSPYEIFCNRYQTRDNTVVVFKENYPSFFKFVGRAWMKRKFDKCFLVFFLDSEEEVVQEGIEPRYKFPKGLVVDGVAFPIYVILRSR